MGADLCPVCNEPANPCCGRAPMLCPICCVKDRDYEGCCFDCEQIVFDEAAALAADFDLDAWKESA